MAKQVRTRIAPSPTGELHVGTARTALFNELFARKHGGVFVVRIEDTDTERSTKDFEEGILEGLTWLGLVWDEGPDVGGEVGPYRQSERGETYRQALQQLLNSDAAYTEEGGESQAIKLRVLPEEIVFDDLIRGRVKVHSDTWGGDFVIARSIDDPLYHLAVVVDDAAMEISHVIRGEDHLTNTARHILLQRALGYDRPEYAHLPLLLDAERKKLSKRAGEVSLLAYREAGYLPEAMVNFLALLGWSPKDDTEFFSHEELRQRFSLDGVQKGGAIFSEQKLRAINKDHLRQLAPEALLEMATPRLISGEYDVSDSEYWSAAIATEQERVATLAELPETLEFFKPDWPSDYPGELLVWRKSDAATTRELLEKLLAELENLQDEQFKEKGLEKHLLGWIDEQQLGRGDTLWPMRVALTGQEHSPGPFEVAAVLGKDRSLDRIRAAIKIIE